MNYFAWELTLSKIKSKDIVGRLRWRARTDYCGNVFVRVLDDHFYVDNIRFTKKFLEDGMASHKIMIEKCIEIFSKQKQKDAA